METEIKVKGYSIGDESVGIGSCDFKIDTGLYKLNDSDREFIIKNIIRNIWDLHDNGDLHFNFSDEDEAGNYDYYVCETRRFGYEQAKKIDEDYYKEKVLSGLK